MQPHAVLMVDVVHAQRARGAGAQADAVVKLLAPAAKADGAQQQGNGGNRSVSCAAMSQSALLEKTTGQDNPDRPSSLPAPNTQYRRQSIRVVNKPLRVFDEWRADGYPVGSMLHALLMLAAGLTSAAAAQAADARFAPWPESGFARAESRWVAENEIYPKADRPAAFALDATVLFARGTPWSEARAMRQIRKTAEIFRACGIGLRRIRLVRLELPKPMRTIDMESVDAASGVPRNVRALAERLPSGTDYPAAFLIGGLRGEESPARSYRAAEPADAKPPYLDTAWIAYRAHWVERNDDLYSPLAHELAHLLCSCGHEKTVERHLLHTARNFLSSRVLPEHCERFRASPLVSPSN